MIGFLIITGIIISVSLVGYFIILPNTVQDVIPENIKFDVNTVDETCIINCENEFDLIKNFLNTKPQTEDILITEFSLIEKFIGNQSPNVEITRIFKHLDSTEKKILTDVSLFRFEFITEINEFIDITDSELSYRLKIDADKIQSGTATFNLLVNDKIESIFIFDLKDDFGLGLISETTPKSIKELLTPEPDGIIRIETHLTELKFTTSDGTFALSEPMIVNQIILDKNNNKILAQNENGFPVKIYPFDSTLKIISHWSDINFVRHGNNHHVHLYCISSTGGYCTRYSVQISSFSPNPPMGIIKVYDLNNSLVFESSTYNGGKDWTGNRLDIRYGTSIIPNYTVEIDLQRNSEYRVTIGTPNDAEFMIKTPETKSIHTYTCTSSTCNFP